MEDANFCMVNNEGVGLPRFRSDVVRTILFKSSNLFQVSFQVVLRLRDTRHQDN